MIAALTRSGSSEDSV